ncbi:MAG: alpha-galactosidase [Candidatus Hydrogenedentes bacterium]|nr:alpha-galactosidase [Candidatus Hydrogenedentota bacterium]
MTRSNSVRNEFGIFVALSLFTFFAVHLARAEAPPLEPYSSRPADAETAFVAQWKQFLLRQGEANADRYLPDLPFSFKCGERSSREWVTLASANIQSGEWQSDNTRAHVFSWTDAQTSLYCEMTLTEFRDFPAFEWVVRVRNDGQADSAKVHDFWGIDTYWNAPDNTMPVLHRSVGSPGHEDDFHFMSEFMHNSMWDKRRRIAMDSPSNAAWGQAHSYLIPNDKRSSAVWLPFFNYQTGGDGLITGLGWSGAWRAYFDHQGNGKSTILAGVENFDSILHPGETVRSTLNVALYWQGELLHGQNMFRKLVLEHYSPRIDGKLVEPPISGVVWGGIPSKEHLEIIEKLKQYQVPLDVYWFDAGWYGTGVVPSYSVFEGDWGPMAGDWRPNPNWHNGTLKPVSDAAHAAGMKFLVWVEPCRALHGRPITLEHPEYFLTGNADGTIRDGQTLLLDLGKPESLKWAVDVVGGLIRDYNIDWYEEDFNIEPNPYLEKAAEPDRWGMKEMRFIEGHFAFWDTLLKEFPKLAILNCASGGRRIDLESISRGQPLWRSDYNCFPEATAESTQDHSYGIQYWLPIQGSMIRGWSLYDTYEARCALSPGQENAIVAKTEPEWLQLKANVVQALRCKKYFFGDYYPLAHEQRSPSAWTAYHLYLPGEQEGMIVALRREKSDVPTMTFDLQTIDPAKRWKFEDYDSGQTWVFSGEQLRKHGFEIVIPNRRDSRLIFYSAEGVAKAATP